MSLIPNQQQTHLFRRRTFILGSLQGVLFTSLLGRLINLQIFNRQHYQLLSDKNRLQIRLSAAPRGNIIDRNNNLLAFNYGLYRCLVMPGQEINLYETIQKLEKILKLLPRDMISINAQLKTSHSFGIMIKENLSWEEMASLELQLPDLPGLVIEKGLIRKYNNPHELCHIIGYVARVAATDSHLSLPTIPGLRIGKIGLEKQYEQQLTGTPSFQKVEVNAKRQVVRIVSENTPTPGKILQLTIDLKLQQKVADVLSIHQSAAAAVMDVNNGDILALVSHPGYDSNQFVLGVGGKEWEQLLHHQDQPLINKVLAGQYSPGSTFKMIVALAALEYKIVNPKICFHCPGYFEFGNRRFHCWNWRYGGHGNVDMERAISQSCDVYFYNVALMLGMDRMCDIAERFGLGKITGIEIPGEKKGLIPNRNWRTLFKFGKERGQALNLSIGQGVILSTPLQLLQMIGSLTKGYIISPRIVKDRDQQLQPKSFLVSHENLEIIKCGMAGVTKEGGTAFHARIHHTEREMAGKTGTTQVSRITMQQRKDGSYRNLPYHLRDHALFVGYAPAHKPKYAVSVIVEHGTGGGKVAAPLARDILIAAQSMDNYQRV